MSRFNSRNSTTNLRFLTLALTVVGIMTLGGCEFAKNQLKPDRDRDMEIQDYRDSMGSRVEDLDSSSRASARAKSSVPSFQPYISGMTENMKPMPLVSISVNQSVPLRDILFELAQQAQYDLELDPRIRGSIIFTARNKPFDLVVSRIADLAGLRYRFEDEILRVEQDLPYSELYKIDYLNYIRSNTGSIRNNISVVNGDGADTGSTFEAASESRSDFWGELETNMQQIMGASEVNRRTTERDPRITATEQNPDVQAVAPTVDANGNIIIAPPDAVLNVESLPVDDEEESQAAGGDEDPFEPRFSLNRQAGIINVFANEKTHKEVDKYLKLLRRASTAQVLIEAKILEVSLADEFATGIDWRSIGLLSGEVTSQYLSSGAGVLDTFRSSVTNAAGAIVTPSGTTQATTSNFVMGYSGNNIEAIAEAVAGFGAVHALASPRLTVLNNQSAVLNVANNIVYFELDIDVTTDDGVTQTNVDSDIRNVPEGVLVNVQPAINLDEGTIQLALRPTITRVVRRVADPAVQFVTAQNNITGVESLIPEVNVQELDTVIQVKSGQAIVMGGLLQDRSTSSEEGVPGLMEIPVFGAFFKQHRDISEKTELVILLKATIMELGDTGVHASDKDLYRTFSGDRRPFKL